MYMQAGRNRGWAVVAAANANAPVAVQVPMEAAMPLPEPPIVVSPVVMMPLMSPPEAEKPQKECQSLAMAYVEMQRWQELYESEQGFPRGTIFKQLDLPFVGEGACKHE